MVDKAQKIYNDGKKGLESLLREKAYTEVKKTLADKGIDIENVVNEDIESLVASKTKDMENALRGFGAGAAFITALSLLTGV